MRFILFTLLLISTAAHSQIENYDFTPVNETELMAMTWIEADSIISHDKVLLFPMSATNQEMRGCMCLIKSNNSMQKAAFICSLPPGKVFNELSSQAQKDAILSKGNGFVYSIKSEDQSIFWWKKE